MICSKDGRNESNNYHKVKVVLFPLSQFEYILEKRA